MNRLLCEDGSYALGKTDPRPYIKTNNTLREGEDIESRVWENVRQHCRIVFYVRRSELARICSHKFSSLASKKEYVNKSECTCRLFLFVGTMEKPLLNCLHSVRKQTKGLL